MSDYKIANLKQIEDSAHAFGYAPDMEARFGRKPLEAERSGVSYQRLAPNFRGPFGHRHAEQEETYVVVSGNRLGDATAVDFGDARSPSFTVLSDAELLVAVPQTWRSGSVNVIVSSPGGRSVPSPGDVYTYVAVI